LSFTNRYGQPERPFSAVKCDRQPERQFTHFAAWQTINHWTPTKADTDGHKRIEAL
jgi:hypothetical protein